MIEDQYFLECPECNTEYNFDDVKVISVFNNHRNIRTCQFVCPCCNEVKDSLMTGVM